MRLPRAPADPGAPGFAASRRHYLVAAVLLAVLLFLRRPSNLLYPQFWAEDSLFFMAASREGFWRSLFTPIAGYLLTFPRLAAGLSLAVPLEAAPLACNLAAFAAQLLPALLLLSPRLAPHFGALPARTLAAAVVVTLPNSYETYVNIANSQWHLCLAALLVLFMAAPGSRRAAVLDNLLLALGAVTGPFAALLLPVPLLRLRAGGDDRGRSARHAALLAAGAAIQALSFFATRRPETTAAVGAPPGAETIARILSTHLTFDTFIGIAGAIRLGRLPLPWHVLGLAIAVGLIAVTVARGSRPLQALLLLSTATIALAFAFPLNPVRGWLAPGYGPRYFQHASLVLAAAALQLALRRGWSRTVGVPLAGVFLLVGVPFDFFHAELADSAWPAQVAAFRSRPPGAGMYLPVNPPGFGGMTLVRGTEPAIPFALPRLPAAGRPAVAELAPPRAGTPDAVAGPTVVFSGLAIDSSNAQPAGAVFLVIDGRVFPAMTGRAPRGFSWQRRHELATEKMFYRVVPLAEIGAGRHTIALAIMSAGRDAWLAPPAASTFVL